MKASIPIEMIERKILLIRGEKFMLDSILLSFMERQREG